MTLRFLLAFTLLFSTFFLSACQSTKQHQALKPTSPSRTVTLNLASEPPNLDPIKVTDMTSFNVVTNLMRGLTQYDQGQAVIPAVAERWTLSNGGKQYDFYLRTTARWSDGKPVIAQEFIDNWKRALTPENGSQYAFFLFPIHNAQAYYEGKLSDFNTVGIKAISPHHLRIQLKEPLAFFPAMLASPVYFPIRLDAIKRYGSRFTEAGNLLSNGPYSLSYWQHEHELRLKPNTYYWGAKPKVASVRLLMIQEPNTSLVLYENKALDVLDTYSASDFRWLSKKKEAHQQGQMGLYYIGFNTQKAPFDDVRVRQAFALALDRSYLPRLLQSGQIPIQSFLPESLSLSNEPVGLGFNAKLAKKRLAEAGYPEGKGFPEVRFVFSGRDNGRKEAEIAQFLWKKVLGVSVRLEMQDWKVFLSTLSTNTPQLYKLSWYADYPDPDSFISLFTSTNDNNHTHWHNRGYNALVKQAAQSQSTTERARLYQEAQQLLLEKETVIIPWYQGQKLWLVQPRLKGFHINSMNLWQLDKLAILPPEANTK